MNKAFTANINDQVTARGYLDENDQLIMLEPEGSGGGGDLATATVEFTSASIESEGSINANIAFIRDDRAESFRSIAIGSSYDVITYKGNGLIVLIPPIGGSYNVTVASGDAEINPSIGGGSEIIVHGDCVINVEADNGTV